MARERPRYTYVPRSYKSVKAQAESSGNRFDSIVKAGVDTWRPKVGDNMIRILPPTWDEHDHFALRVYVHKYVGADKSTYLCPRKMLNKPCAICEAATAAAAAGETEDEKALKYRDDYIAWIIDRKENDNVPLVWQFSWGMNRDILNVSINQRTGKVINLDNPDLGYDLMFKRIGNDIRTKYSGLMLDREATPIADDQKEQDAIMDYIMENPLTSVLNYHDNKYLSSVVGGTAERDTDEEHRPVRGRRIDPEEADETDTRTARRPPSRRDTDNTETRRTRDQNDVSESRTRARARPDPKDDPELDEGRPRSRSHTRADDDRSERGRGRERDAQWDDETADPEVDEPAPRTRTRARADDEHLERVGRGNGRERLRAEPRTRARDPEDTDEDPETDDPPPRTERSARRPRA